MKTANGQKAIGNRQPATGNRRRALRHKPCEGSLSHSVLSPQSSVLIRSLCVLALVCGLGSLSSFAQEKARRWVSLSPSVTEVLFDIGVGPEVVGVCAPADYPPEARSCKAVASWEKVDIEAILALRPTACFTIEGMQGPEVLLSLRRLGLEVHVYPMRDLEDLWACFRGVGALAGRASEAEARVKALKDRIAIAVEPLRGPVLRGVVVVGLAPLVAAGKASFLDGILSLCRIENALASKGEAYPSLSLEQLASARSRIVILPEGENPKAGRRAVPAFPGGR